MRNMFPNPRLLLDPQIPKPMHGLNPRTVKGAEWWEVQRQIAYKKFAYHCAACGVHKSKARLHQWLEAHERYSIDYAKGRMKLIEINPLCHFCHNYIHEGFLRAKRKQGAISSSLYDEIIEHGNQIVRVVIKNYLPPDPKTFAPWANWRLVVEGKEYPPLWKNHEEWAAHYSKPINLKPWDDLE